MWVLVLRGDNGTVITNATFSITYYNRGDGYYYLYVTQWNEGFTSTAPGFNTIWGNTDYYSSMTIWLSVSVPPPPPPPGGGGWT